MACIQIVSSFLLLSLIQGILATSIRQLSSEYNTGRIVGGEPVEWGEIPWQVSLQDNTRDQFCGGSIISNEWIVTVAHCSFITAADYRVVSGTLEFKVNGTVHVISEIIKHADYNGNTFENDIAVWKVDPPFVWDEQTGPVKLPEQGLVTPEDVNITVSGWGDKSYGGFLSQVLLETEIPIVPKQTCNRNYILYGGIGPNMICAGLTEGGRGSCQGDSGGPVMYDGTLVGLVSWGLGCAWEGYPSVFTEVSAYRDWIRENSGV